MIYVLDTHPIIWFVENDPRLSATARTVMLDPSNSFIVPTMVLVEIKYLHSKGRIKPDLARVYQRFIKSSNCKLHDLDEEVVSMISTGLNIHDAIITATGLVYRDLRHQQTALITKDHEITQSGLIQILW
jgi:PIN domain nuclease of toxin-antitoxin system